MNFSGLYRALGQAPPQGPVWYTDENALPTDATRWFSQNYPQPQPGGPVPPGSPWERGARVPSNGGQMVGQWPVLTSGAPFFGITNLDYFMNPDWPRPQFWPLQGFFGQ